MNIFRNYLVKNPVVLFGYNKPDTTQQVLKQIKKVQPKKIYLVLDGAKSEREKNKCIETKKIFDNVNFDAEVIKIYSKKNLGLKKRWKSALDEIFSKEESAIILEDDTLPSISFFRFCDELLEKYKYKKQISQINGYNYFSKVSIKEDYYFTTYPELWGWATWQDRWKKYYNDDLENEWDKIKNTEDFYSSFFSNEEFEYFYTMYENAVNNIVDSWDFKWSYSLRKNNLLSIAPSRNLVKNLGFGHDGATHTHQRHKYLSVTRNKQYNIQFPLKHPNIINKNLKLIENDFNKRLLKNSKLSKLIYRFNKLKKILI